MMKLQFISIIITIILGFVIVFVDDYAIDSIVNILKKLFTLSFLTLVVLIIYDYYIEQKENKK